MTTGTRAVPLNNAVAIPTLAIGVFRVLDLTATEAARGTSNRRPQCRTPAIYMSRVQLYEVAHRRSHAGWAGYGAGLCHRSIRVYEREIRPGSAISARSLQ